MKSNDPSVTPADEFDNSKTKKRLDGDIDRARARLRWIVDEALKSGSAVGLNSASCSVAIFLDMDLERQGERDSGYFEAWEESCEQERKVFEKGHRLRVISGSKGRAR
jgi:hypothetical protein